MDSMDKKDKDTSKIDDKDKVTAKDIEERISILFAQFSSLNIVQKGKQNIDITQRWCMRQMWKMLKQNRTKKKELAIICQHTCLQLS